MRTDSEQTKGPASKVDGWYHTAEWLIVAFAVTLVFIVFEMQAYTIPTGSMADTLMGAHFRLRCPQCAYPFEYDYSSGDGQGTAPGHNVPLGRNRLGVDQPRCPSCGNYFRTGQRFPVVKGDRIFVLKTIYQFFEPNRWDVVVFKNPINPRENYIKRLVGLPGETLEIIDGDIYINGLIARKPQQVQQELWLPVYNNDYQVVEPEKGNYKAGKWRIPFVNLPGSQWDLSAGGGRVFTLDAAGEDVHTLVYDTTIGNDFRAAHSYDSPVSFDYMPVVSDLRVQFHVGHASEGLVGASISKYGTQYRGTVDLSGRLRIERKAINTAAQELASTQFDPGAMGPGPAAFSFAVVDHQVVLRYGERTLVVDMGSEPTAMGMRWEGVPDPEVTIRGRGRLQLSHIAVSRDLHYLSTPKTRAREGEPFQLDEDQFFVLGDNTPNSADARVWATPGIGNRLPGGERHEYRMGTVPRDYLIGKAFFVYWPGPHKPFNDSWLAQLLERGPQRVLKILMNVPDPDGIKFIYGGSRGGEERVQAQ